MTGSISRHQMVGSISQRFRRKHFSSLKSGKHQQNCWHFAALWPEAFRSAFAGSISHRQGGREASAYAGISQRFRRKHFTSSGWTGSISVLLVVRANMFCFLFVFVWLRLCLCLCWCCRLVLAKGIIVNVIPSIRVKGEERGLQN